MRFDVNNIFNLKSLRERQLQISENIRKHYIKNKKNIDKRVIINILDKFRNKMCKVDMRVC